MRRSRQVKALIQGHFQQYPSAGASCRSRSMHACQLPDWPLNTAVSWWSQVNAEALRYLSSCLSTLNADTSMRLASIFGGTRLEQTSKRAAGNPGDE
jgi:hypothetical protein